MKKVAKYLIIFWLLFFAFAIAMEATRHVTMNGPRINGTPKKIISFMSSLISNIAKYSGISNPIVIKNTFALNNGFNHIENCVDNKDYLLISVWDNTLSQSIVKLVRIRDGKVLHKWVPEIIPLISNFNSKTENKLGKSTTRLFHPLVLRDGSLVFGAGTISKIDLNSKIVWSSITPSSHSIEQDCDGYFWICGFNTNTSNSKKYQIIDEAIQKISPIDGKLLFEKSVFELLMENGYGRGIFFINPQLTAKSTNFDYVHLNEVQPVLSDSKYWKKGDLFLSLRHQNLVLLYRPSTNKIIWSQNGPWLRQHDVEIIDSSRIGIFGNNVIDAKFINDDDRFIDGYNNQYVYDFSKNE